MSKKIAVVAIGGNSLITDAGHKTVPDQYDAVIETCRHLADMIEAGWRLVITHGNGPQVGFILRRSELASHELHEVPLDSCGADTQGAIGYMIQKALRNDLRRRGNNLRPITLITEVLVDQNDPAFNAPSKPIGSFMDEETAKRNAAKNGWQVVEDAGRGWRRVVASPRPQRIVEFDAIKSLLEKDYVVIAVGGGGIPVIQREDGSIEGVESVIDKDFASALLASELQADLLLISTSVEQVALNFRQKNERWLSTLSLKETKKYLAEGHFPKGSMGPKIQAIISFLEAGGKEALITNPESIKAALQGKTGTKIMNNE